MLSPLRGAYDLRKVALSRALLRNTEISTRFRISTSTCLLNHFVFCALLNLTCWCISTLCVPLHDYLCLFVQGSWACLSA